MSDTPVLSKQSEPASIDKLTIFSNKGGKSTDTDAELAVQVCADFKEGPATGHTCNKANFKRHVRVFSWHLFPVERCPLPSNGVDVSPWRKECRV